MNDLQNIEMLIIDTLAKILRHPEIMEYLRSINPIPMPSKQEEISRRLWDAISQQATQAKCARASAKLEQDNVAKYFGKNQTEEEFKKASAKTLKANADREKACLDALKKMPLLDVLHL